MQYEHVNEQLHLKFGTLLDLEVKQNYFLDASLIFSKSTKSIQIVLVWKTSHVQKFWDWEDPPPPSFMRKITYFFTAPLRIFLHQPHLCAFFLIIGYSWPTYFGQEKDWLAGSCDNNCSQTSSLLPSDGTVLWQGEKEIIQSSIIIWHLWWYHRM